MGLCHQFLVAELARVAQLLSKFGKGVFIIYGFFLGGGSAKSWGGRKVLDAKQGILGGH